MATEDPPSKHQRGQELDVEQEAEEIEPITSLTDLPASVLMRIHELIIGDECAVLGGSRLANFPSKLHSVGASAGLPPCKAAPHLHADSTLVLPPSLHAQAAQWRMTCRATRASAQMPEELKVPEGLHESGGAWRTWAFPLRRKLLMAAC
jgi:hypothetical protein